MYFVFYFVSLSTELSFIESSSKHSSHQNISASVTARDVWKTVGFEQNIRRPPEEDNFFYTSPLFFFLSKKQQELYPAFLFEKTVSE